DERAIEARGPARRRVAAAPTGERDRERLERRRSRVGRGGGVETELDERQRAAGAVHDKALLPHLRRLRRERRRDELFATDSAEGEGGALDERLRAVVADDDDVRVVRRVVPAVVRVEAVAGHE